MSVARTFGTDARMFSSSSTAQHFPALDPTHCRQGALAQGRPGSNWVASRQAACVPVDPKADSPLSAQIQFIIMRLMPSSQRQLSGDRHHLLNNDNWVESRRALAPRQIRPTAPWSQITIPTETIAAIATRREAGLLINRNASSIAKPTPARSTAATAKSNQSQTTSTVNCIAINGLIRRAINILHKANRHPNGFVLLD